jgi:ubiquinone/menaquinone biosynthesis C-methylase UbiE
MTGSPKDVSLNWYENAFSDFYGIVYAHRTIEAAAPEVAFAASLASLGRHDFVLDLCCGTGRHLYHLAQTSSRTYGLDYSSVLLADARERVGTNSTLVRADMRHIPFTNTFNLVTSFFTSFGYFQDDVENENVLREIARVLRSGGRFFLDHVNATYLRATLVPETTRKQHGYEIRERRWIDDIHHRINKATHVFLDGVEVHHSGESVRLYEHDELSQAMRRAGLAADAVYGGYTGAEFGPSQPRMLFFGHKE